ncbi:MAG: FAD-dependent oxidoreductase [Alphaproteobacteria bacterium]|nr:FAD-dependent oxidoreductase [Alphaproteobacteria bacterium]
MDHGVVIEPERRIPVAHEADVVVLGGGPSGIAAAVAASRHGARTLLVERYGFLGGNCTAAMVTNFCGLHANVHGELRQVVHGVADEMLARLERLGGLNAPHLVFGRIQAQAYDVAAFKCAADDMLVDAGVTLRLHSLAAGVAMADGRIDALLVETKSGRQAIRGRMFVDCSGDADLAAWAGAPYEKGPAMAFPTHMFRVGAVDGEAALAARPRIRALMEQAEQEGAFRFHRHTPIVAPQKRNSEWRCNVTQIARGGRAADGTDADDLIFAELEGRRQIRDYFAFLKARVPGFADSYLLEIAPQIGIRETRRIVGAYQVSGDDVLGACDFADTVGVNGWPMERHVAGDVAWGWIEGRGYHQVPFRCLVPRGVGNLLVAGRCASLTAEGQSSVRVSGPCFVMGQAAGTAAALALRAGVAPGAVDVAALQSALRADGVWLG